MLTVSVNVHEYLTPIRQDERYCRWCKMQVACDYMLQVNATLLTMDVSVYLPPRVPVTLSATSDDVIDMSDFPSVSEPVLYG